MEKIIVVLSAHKPDIASIDFACRIAALTGSKLTGLFVENLYYHSPVSSMGEKPYFQAVQQEEGGSVVTTDTDQVVRLFVAECSLHQVAAETYIDKGEPIQEVIYESRFADLLIVDPKINFYDRVEQLPSHFTKEILSSAECPVLLAPDKSIDIEEIVFCYDGSPSSVFALKQFTYLLPQLKNKKAILLEVNSSGKEEFNEDHRRIMNWLRAHYESVSYQGLKGTAKDELFIWFFMKTNKLAVMGSYGRTALSKFFKHSTADTLIRTIDLPIFITHYNH
ncbi:MAG: hypothetical protein EON98_00210 [Chitinophagaceae bacterium]|nr:MAG: hypothetical protein EON98_00210 [Chitinophagaceae bacterium]